MDNTYSDFSVEAAVRIVEACLAAQRPELIVPALLDRRSPESVVAELAVSPTTGPAAAPAIRSIFGDGPTPEQRDSLTEAVRRRFAAMAAKPAA
jgi:hypothetical protein